MGVVANSVKDLSLGHLENIITQNLISNLDMGSKLCPVVSECRDFAEGITFGDQKMACLNGVFLSAYALPIGTVLPTNVKLTMMSAQTGMVNSLAKGTIAGSLMTIASSNSSMNVPVQLDGADRSDVSNGSSNAI